MKDRALLACLFFLIVTVPGEPSKIALFTGAYLSLRIHVLIRKTISVRRRGPEVHYVMSPGQAVVDATAQVLRHLAFAIEFLLAVVYGRLLAFMCDAPDRRNILALYTLIFAILHSWEFIIFEIYNKNSARVYRS